MIAHCGRIAYETGGCFPHGQPTFPYNEWSGFLSIFLPPLITLAGVALLWAWHHQCHVHRCYWPTTRVTAAGERACWRHSPWKRRTAADIHAAHHAALSGRPGTAPGP